MKQNWQYLLLNSIEAYDHHKNKWTSIPSMLPIRLNHPAVNISNKLFMIGDCSKMISRNIEAFENCEVFDSVNRKFTFIKSLPTWINNIVPNKTVCVCYNICFIFRGNENNEIKVYSYDINQRFIYLKD